MSFNVRRVCMHTNPHLDEIASLWALQKFGADKYPGIKTTQVVFEGGGGEDLKGVSAENLEKDGVLAIGVGGGRFDEHPGAKTPGVEGKCAFDLVVENLGVQNDPGMTKIIAFIRSADLSATGHPFDLACLIKAMTKYHSNVLEVIAFVFCALESKYQEQCDFERAANEVFRGCREEAVERGRRIVRIFIAETDNTEFSKAARTKGADVVIQRQPTGNVQIFTNQHPKSAKVKIERIVQSIRQEERELKDKDAGTDWDELSRDGKIEGVEEWYYHLKGQMLLNGSTSCPDVPPTKIPLEDIVTIVKHNVMI